MSDATHAEYGPAGTEVISLLSCSLQGRQILIQLRAGSILNQVYQSLTAVEKTTCSYGLNPELRALADEKGMAVSGTDETGDVRAVERPEHPFFVATLYQPQLTSTADSPHPIFVSFVAAVASGTGTGLH